MKAGVQAPPPPPRLWKGCLAPLAAPRLPPHAPWAFLQASLPVPARYSRSVGRDGGRGRCSPERIVHSPAPTPQVRAPVGNGCAGRGVGEPRHCKRGGRRGDRVRGTADSLEERRLQGWEPDHHFTWPHLLSGPAPPLPGHAPGRVLPRRKT